MSTKKRNDKGFTLIELIIVIVILGIIAGVAVPKVIGLAGSAKISAARGVGGAMSGTISAQHADYLLNTAQTYNAADVIAGTTFGGGITGGMITDAAGSGTGDLTLLFKGNNFVWTYTAASGETPATLTEKTGF